MAHRSRYRPGDLRAPAVQVILSKLDFPPVWLMGFMALAWTSAAGGANPSAAWDRFVYWPGWALIVAGIALALWSALAFRAARTTIIPRQRPSALVEAGPYRFSRNPIYVADLVILAGWCLVLGAPLAVVLVVPFWWVLERRFILPEEAVLAEDLGQPYLDYKARVRRWI